MEVVLQDFIGKLRIVVLLGENMQKFGHGLGEMFKVRQTLDNRSLRSYPNVSFRSAHHAPIIPTKSLSMMLDCNAQDFECMHTDGHALDPLFTLEDQIDCSGK